MKANGVSTSPRDGHLLDLAAQLFAADAGIVQALDAGPPGWWHWMGRRAAARVAARIRPDVTDLATTAWTLLAELSAAESGHATARGAARRMSASYAAGAGPGDQVPGDGRRHERSGAMTEVVPLGLDIFGIDDSDGGGLSWQDIALCAQTDPEAFFPEKGGSTREAKTVCRSCEVRTECLEYALEHDERFGIWGGLSERERRRIKRGG